MFIRDQKRPPAGWVPSYRGFLARDFESSGAHGCQVHSSLRSVAVGHSTGAEVDVDDSPCLCRNRSHTTHHAQAAVAIFLLSPTLVGFAVGRAAFLCPSSSGFAPVALEPPCGRSSVAAARRISYIPENTSRAGSRAVAPFSARRRLTVPPFSKSVHSGHDGIFRLFEKRPKVSSCNGSPHVSHV
jgi:hypothetical protein